MKHSKISDLRGKKIKKKILQKKYINVIMKKYKRKNKEVEK